MVFIRTISGQKYVYKSVRKNGKVKSVYVGKVGSVDGSNALKTQVNQILKKQNKKDIKK